MTPASLTRLPIFACAALILALFVVNLWNSSVGIEWPKLRIRSAEPLSGVPAPGPVPVSLQALLSGETQKAFSTSLGQKMPVFPISVRAKNQFLYSVFDASGAPDIVVGRERQLYEDFYVGEFCARGKKAPNPAAIDAWATTLRATQDAVEAKGKRFVYLIAPSKAARLTRFLPAHLHCPSLSNGAAEKLAPYRAALDASGVAYVDGAGLVTAAAGDYPIDLFPRGGTHWNYLGSAVAARELTRILNRDGKASAIPAYDFQWGPIARAMRPTDRDLLTLLNLLRPDMNYPTAAIEGRSAAPCESAPKIMAVGGSFLIEPMSNLVEAPCSAQADFWHYIRRGPDAFVRLRFSMVKRNGFASLDERGAVSEAEFDASLTAADVVVLEENEAVIGEMRQVADLLAAATR